MAAERPQSVFKRGVERVAELSQKADIVVFAIGGGFLLFGSTGVGLLIIGGNAITYFGAEKAKKWARGGKGK